MTTALTKKKKVIEKLFDKEKQYKLTDAIDILKNSPKAKFNETVEIAINLGLDPKDTAQAVRGTARLPHGTGKNLRMAVFCKGEDEKKAKDTGADFAGSDELIKKITEGWCDFDVAIATTAMMKDIARLGKVLGPRGLMPNPKTGTVTDDVEKTIKEIKAGKIEFKMDKQAGIHVGVGKISFSKEELAANIRQLMNSVIASNPNLNRPQTIKSISISTTMGPGIRLDVGEFRE